MTSDTALAILLALTPASAITWALLSPRRRQARPQPREIGTGIALLAGIVCAHWIPKWWSCYGTDLPPLRHTLIVAATAMVTLPFMRAGGRRTGLAIVLAACGLALPILSARIVSGGNFTLDRALPVPPRTRIEPLWHTRFSGLYRVDRTRAMPCAEPGPSIGPPVVPRTAAGPMEPPSGGAIATGLYHLTSWLEYGRMVDAATESIGQRVALRIRREGAAVYFDRIGETGDSTSSVVYVDGAELSESLVCPIVTNGFAKLGYTAREDTLTLYNGNIVKVFTRQQQ